MVPLFLIIRPQPGAAATAARAAEMGADAVVAPLFRIEPVAWTAPDPGGFDALLLTSANAARHAGGELSAYARLPCYCVGEATAEAARQRGLRELRIGPSDGAAALDLIARNGAARALHLCGRDHIGLQRLGLHLERRIVYAAVPVDALPDDAKAALSRGAVTLLHSPRAASVFAELAGKAGLDRSDLKLAAISPAAADAAGKGWRLAAAAAEPRDQALLELAAKLCKTVPTSDTGLCQ